MLQKIEYPRLGETLYAGTAPDGLRIRVLPKKGWSGFYAVFATDYGGAYRRFTLDGAEYDTPAGVAHFLEHKMFDLPNGDNALNLLSMNGAEPNAFTSSCSTCYFFQCTHSFEENLRLLLHFVSTPYFTEESVQKEQGIIGQEIAMGDDSAGTANYYQLLQMLYEYHPIREKVIGSVESIASITAETLYACHKAYYTPGNMVLCVEGDVDPERILAIVNEELPAESGSVPVTDFGEPENLLPLETLSYLEMPVAQPLFLIGAKLAPSPKGPEFLRNDLIATLALRLLCGPTSSFYNRLYAEGLLNRKFDYETDSSAGTRTLIIGGESNSPETVLARLNEEATRIAAEGFDTVLFERAKRAGIGNALRAMEDFDNVCVSLALDEFDGFCYLDYPETLADITKEECEAFVREALAPERLALAIVAGKKADA